MLDADLLVLDNVDELFDLPELSGSPMIETHEKIVFFKTSEYGLRINNKVDRGRETDAAASIAPATHTEDETDDGDIGGEGGLIPGWSGLNSGVTVLVPSNVTFTQLLNELSIIPNRPCCPSQEFLYYFFEERKRYFRIPGVVYNSRGKVGGGSKVGGGGSVGDGLTKIHHFVGQKPWKRRDAGNSFNRRWWMYRDEVYQVLEGDFLKSM